jgi:hypothetical protein
MGPNSTGRGGRTVVSVRVPVPSDGLALGGEVQGLGAGAVDSGLVVGGFVVAVATGGFIVWRIG